MYSCVGTFYIPLLKVQRKRRKITEITYRNANPIFERDRRTPVTSAEDADKMVRSCAKFCKVMTAKSVFIYGPNIQIELGPYKYKVQNLNLKKSLWCLARNSTKVTKL